MTFKNFYFISALLFGCSAHASQVLNMNPNARISAKISFDSMNRIAIDKDRISQVFGDENTYTTQIDEMRGQLFLKPTAENGDKPIHLTITSENDVVQDIELLPDKINTQTLILKGEKQLVENKNASKSYPSLGYSSAFSSNGGTVKSRSSQIIYALKKTITESDMENSVITDTAAFDDKEIKSLGLKVNSLFARVFDNLQVDVFELSNPTKNSIELLESMFKGENVVAVSLLRRQLNVKEKARVYIVRNIATSH